MPQPSNGNTRREHGRVKMFNDQKGFGFIVQNNGGPDLFFHRSGLAKTGGSNRHASIPEGTLVEYEETLGDRGPKAINVTTVR
jgi:cold shock CspA family protein